MILNELDDPQVRRQMRSFKAIRQLFTCVPDTVRETDGSQRWYSEGKLHRLDGPALICPNGASYWYYNGRKHRDDGPAVEYPCGQKEWYRDGELVRKQTADGSTFWYRDGKRHRDDGPAIERADGTSCWYQDGCPCAAIRQIIPTLQAG